MLHVDYNANTKNQTLDEIGFGDMRCTLTGEIYDLSPGSPWFLRYAALVHNDGGTWF